MTKLRYINEVVSGRCKLISHHIPPVADNSSSNASVLHSELSFVMRTMLTVTGILCMWWHFIFNISYSVTKTILIFVICTFLFVKKQSIIQKKKSTNIGKHCVEIHSGQCSKTMGIIIILWCKIQSNFVDFVNVSSAIAEKSLWDTQSINHRPVSQEAQKASGSELAHNYTTVHTAQVWNQSVTVALPRWNIASTKKYENMHIMQQRKNKHPPTAITKTTVLIVQMILTRRAARA